MGIFRLIQIYLKLKLTLMVNSEDPYRADPGGGSPRWIPQTPGPGLSAPVHFPFHFRVPTSCFRSDRTSCLGNQSWFVRENDIVQSI